MSAIERGEDELFEFLVLVILLAIVAVALFLYFKLKGFDLSNLLQQLLAWLKNLFNKSAGSGGSNADYLSDSSYSGVDSGKGPYQIVTGISSSMAAAMQQDAGLDSPDYYEENNAQ